MAFRWHTAGYRLRRPKLTPVCLISMVTPRSRLPSYTRLHTSVTHPRVHSHYYTHSCRPKCCVGSTVPRFSSPIFSSLPHYVTFSPQPKAAREVQLGLLGEHKYTISTAVGCKAVSACLSPMLLSSCLPEKQSTAHLSPSLPVPAFLLRTMLEHSWGSARAAVGALRWGLGRSLCQLCVWCRKS